MLTACSCPKRCRVYESKGVLEVKRTEPRLCVRKSTIRRAPIGRRRVSENAEISRATTRLTFFLQLLVVQQQTDHLFGLQGVGFEIPSWYHHPLDLRHGTCESVIRLRIAALNWITTYTGVSDSFLFRRRSVGCVCVEKTLLFIPRSSPWPAVGFAPLWCLYIWGGKPWPVWSGPVCELGPWPADPPWGSSHCRRKSPAEERRTRTLVTHTRTPYTDSSSQGADINIHQYAIIFNNMLMILQENYHTNWFIHINTQVFPLRLENHDLFPTCGAVIVVIVPLSLCFIIIFLSLLRSRRSCRLIYCLFPLFTVHHSFYFVSSSSSVVVVAVRHFFLPSSNNLIISFKIVSLLSFCFIVYSIFLFLFSSRSSFIYSYFFLVFTPVSVVTVVREPFPPSMLYYLCYFFPWSFLLSWLWSLFRFFFFFSLFNAATVLFFFVCVFVSVSHTTSCAMSLYTTVKRVFVPGNGVVVVVVWSMDIVWGLLTYLKKKKKTLQNVEKFKSGSGFTFLTSIISFPVLKKVNEDVSVASGEHDVLRSLMSRAVNSPGVTP